MQMVIGDKASKRKINSALLQPKPEKENGLNNREQKNLIDNIPIRNSNIQCKLVIKEKRIISKLELFINALTKQITSIISLNDDIKEEDLIEQNKSIFYFPELPDISIKDYIFRILSKSNIEYSTIILTGIYIDNFCTKSEFHLTKFNIYRLFFSAFYCAVKYNEDNIGGTIFYSKLGGISIEELILLEYSFLNGIEFELYVKSKQYFKCEKYFMVKWIKDSKNREWNI